MTHSPGPVSYGNPMRRRAGTSRIPMPPHPILRPSHSAKDDDDHGATPASGRLGGAAMTRWMHATGWLAQTATRVRMRFWLRHRMAVSLGLGAAGHGRGPRSAAPVGSARLQRRRRARRRQRGVNWVLPNSTSRARVGHRPLALVLRQHRAPRAAPPAGRRPPRTSASRCGKSAKSMLRRSRVAQPGIGDDVGDRVFVAGQPLGLGESRLSSTRCSRITSF